MSNVKAYGNPDSKNIIIQPADEHDLSLMESETEEVKRLLQSDDFCILAYPVSDWNRELSPWEAPAVFGKEDFGKGAKETLDIILKDVVGVSERRIDEQLSLKAERKTVLNAEAKGDENEEKTVLNAVVNGDGNYDKKYYLAGYSLAGLFSLWSAFQTDIFAGVVAASPSMWFPNFISYTKENELKTDRVYLSLGKKEEKTKNPVMRTVGDCVREEYEILQNKGIATVLEWNEGNHFVDSDKRVAKGIAWMFT